MNTFLTRELVTVPEARGADAASVFVVGCSSGVSGHAPGVAGVQTRIPAR